MHDDDAVSAADEPTADAAPDAAEPRGRERFPCGTCGAELHFRPGMDSLACPYCGARTAIVAAQTPIVELDYREHLAQLAEAEPLDLPVEMQCGGCAAIVRRPPNVTAMDCPFCGQSLIELADARRVIRPSALLPFSVTREQAFHNFRAWMRGRWFAPDKLKRFARSEGLFQGVYVPFWTYDAAVTTAYEGRRGDHYYVTEGHGDNKRRKRKTRWRSAAGVVRDRFDDILVLASRSRPAQEIQRIGPWDLENLVPITEAYLAGMLAESYEIDLPGGFDTARETIDRTVRNTVRRDIGGDEQRITSMQMSFDELTFKHILLPVWVGGYRFRDRTFSVFVNGRTGEVYGQRPWSWVKIALTILAVLVVAGVIALLASMR